MVLLLMKKRTLFSKIQAVRAHEVKLVSWASQLSLQALEETRHEGVGVCSANSLAVNAAGAFQPTPRRRHGVAPITSLIQHKSAFVRGKASYF